MGVQSAFPRATNYTGGETLSGLTRVAEDAHSRRACVAATVFWLRCKRLQCSLLVLPWTPGMGVRT